LPRRLAHFLHSKGDMKTTTSKSTYRVDELVAAAYRAAQEETRNPWLVALLASKILEDWLTKSDRPDLVRRLATASS
jgi:hypothetical protein